MDFCSNDEQYFGGLMGATNSPEQFSAYNGITVTEVKDGVGVGELDITSHSLNPGGIVHGGCLASLADTVAGVAAAVGQHRRCVTVNYSLSFLRPAKASGKKIVCVATPHKLGKTLCVYGVSLTDDGGKEVASGTFTFFLLDNEH